MTSVIMGSEEVTYGRDEVTKPEICKKAAVYSALHAQISYKVSSEAGRDEWVRKIKLQNLRNRKKLCLVLDLDQTLLHTKRVDKLSSAEEIGLYNSSPKDDLCRWEASGVEFLTKLRPPVRKFLREASQLFEMYVYTNGSRDYARIMVGFLDPDKIYFGSRIISREDSTVKGQKGLDVVPVHKSGVLVLDDTESVWQRDRSNLMLIKPYDYFALKDPNGSRSLSQEGTDESGSAGPLSCALRHLQEAHKSYFEIHEELIGILLEDNGIYEEKLQELMDGNSLCDMGSRKRMRVMDENSLGDMGSRKRMRVDDRRPLALN